MRTNPSFVWALGDDELHTAATLYDFMRAGQPDASAIGAYANSLLIGVARMTREGNCIGSRAATFGEPPAFEGAEPPPEERLTHWMRALHEHEPTWPHWHLGPVAVEPGFQSRGIGRKTIVALVEQVKAEGLAACLETDKPANVRFYESVGFELVDEVDTFGNVTWFMDLRV
jgi:GNAT superfamily N-acetyltransferase